MRNNSIPISKQSTAWQVLPKVFYDTIMNNLQLTLKKSLWIPASCVLCLTCFNSNGQAPIRLSINPSAAYYIGVSYSYNIRNGVYEFIDAQKSQITPRSNLNIFGCQAGKRVQLNRNLRLQLGLQFEKGSAWDTTIIQYDFTHFGVEPELQYSLPAYENFTPYFLIGAGINYLSAKEHIYLINGTEKQEWSDLPNNNSNEVSLSAAAGVGLDIPLTPSLLFNASYLFRYWQPVSYSDALDFPLNPPNYHEVFYSSVLQANLMFSLK